MLDLHIEQWTPKFILNDHNGYAMAKAIEAGLHYMNCTVREGVDVLTDYETMPEWRLDELAWEYNIPYEYDADIDSKRRWIRDASKLSRMLGTAAGVSSYLSQHFGDAQVTEWFDYGGAPYHFKITLPGSPTSADIAWAEKALEKVMNVRSVLDTVEEYDAYTDETNNVLVDEVGVLYDREG